MHNDYFEPLTISKYLMVSGIEYIVELALADDSIWNIVAVDDRAYDVVSALAKAMQLESIVKNVQKKSRHSTPRRLIVHVEDQKRDSARLTTTAHLTFVDQNTICAVISDESHEMRIFQLMHLSLVICRDAQCRGGVLLHGALAEWNGTGDGVILAGPGGRGKTTASRRLPHHWQSFSDDTTLVVCDNKGVYWAHPWPTWSTLMFNEPEGTWNVQHAVPLKGIFFLEQAQKDKFKPLGIGQSICLLNESAEQVSWSMPGHEEKNVLRKLRIQRFDNICALAKTVSSYVLRMGSDGAFWREIEKALNG
jgi:SynChlorMet cassette protein ScmC